MRILPVIAVACLFAEMFTATAAIAEPPPPAPREFRGVWIPSVGNISWPSKAGLPVDQQKQEILDLLDEAVRLHLNAIVVQVRPAADALYASEIEPWSQYLTGVAGQAPSPFYDPLEMWITEAHRRGIELHAWYNLYRAGTGASGAPAANHISRTHPEIVRPYGKYLWMDPGEPQAAQHTLSVIMDIVRRYDVDGIHTDDYYYPYPVKDEATKKAIPFPDDQSYGRYTQSGGSMSRADWRRENINQLVRRIYADTKRTKPWVKVGYGPFGIWKNDVPVRGLSSTDELYSDSKLWLNEGWLDYVCPQLYWPIEGDQPFPVLLEWWIEQSKKSRSVWPGIAAARHSKSEVLNQLDLTRKSTGSRGAIFWNINEIRQHKEKLADALLRGPYREAALIPAATWLDDSPPPPPKLSTRREDNGALILSLKPGRGEPTALYAIWARYGDNWRFLTVPGGAPSISLNPDLSSNTVSSVVITAVDRCGNECERQTLSPR